MNGGRTYYSPMTISHLPGPAYAAPATSSATLNSILTTTASPRTAAQQFQVQHPAHQQHTTQHIHQQNQQHQELGRRGAQETLATVPAKRKIRDVSQSPPGLGGWNPLENDLLRTPPARRGQHINNSINNHHIIGSSSIQNGNGFHSPYPPIHPPPTPSPAPTPASDVSSEQVDCMCGFAVDDGFSIACDLCGRWCHSACFGIAQGGPVPDAFECWVCRPRPREVRERAMSLQRERLGGGVLGVSGVGLGLGLVGIGEEGTGRGRRRVSPAAERKGRRGSTTAALEGGPGPAKRRRRPSVVQHLQPAAGPSTPGSASIPLSATSASISHVPAAAAASTTTTTNGAGEEEHVDVDTEPWTATYVPITQDIVPDDETRSKLRRHARAWRGVTAVSSPPPTPYPSTQPVPLSPQQQPATPPTTIRAVPPTPSPLLPSTNPLCLPPAYATYTNRPVASSSMLVPFHSLITPSAAYLREPTNGYAGLGMPKPHVHLLGPPLGVALDARGVGSEGRFVRWGCRPNAVLRPVICRQGGVAVKGGIRAEGVVDEDATEDEETPDELAARSRRRAEKAKANGNEDEEDDTTLGFAVFALRDLKEGEEVVLGWEWDDGHAIHRLPALLRAPGMFPSVSPSSPHPHKNTKHSPAELVHLRNQLSNILHALASTFTTCACGAATRDCALLAMARAVDRLEDAGADLSSFHISPSAWPALQETDEGMQERGPPGYGYGYGHGRRALQPEREVDLGPLVGRKRGFRTRERVPYSGGLGGMEAVDDEGEDGKETRRKASFKLVVSPDAESPGLLDGRGKATGKGKERSRDGQGDVEMADGEGADARAASNEHQRIDDTLLNPHAIRRAAVPTLRAHPSLEPRPPDPPDLGSSASIEPQNEDRMPPKMRKRWMHREVEALHARPAPAPPLPEVQAQVQDTPPPLHADDENEQEQVQVKLTPFGAGFPGGGVGLGIRLDDSTDGRSAYNVLRTPSPASSPAPPADQLHRAHQQRVTPEQHQEPTQHLAQPQPHTHPHTPPHPYPHQQQHVHEHALMPPPPMPAALDPTTVSSQSPATPTPTPTPSPPSPHLPTPSPGAHRAPEVHVHVHVQEHGHGHGHAVSPLSGFESLSLLSPAVVQAQTQMHGKAPETEIREERAGPLDDVLSARVDEDVEMEVAAAVDGEAREEAEWTPIRRVRQVAQEDEGEDKGEALPPLEVPAVVDEVSKSSRATTSPLDSAASTPSARASPPAVESDFEPLPNATATAAENDVANEDEDMEMEVDVHPPTPEAPLRSLTPPGVVMKHAAPSTTDEPLPIAMDDVGSLPSVMETVAQPPTPLGTVAPPPGTLDVVAAPPPEHFFDTDDEDEWKRQMESGVAYAGTLTKERARSASPQLLEEKTPTQASFLREERSASPTPVDEESADEQDEPPSPPPTTTTVGDDVDLPPASADSAAMEVAETPQAGRSASPVPPSAATIADSAAPAIVPSVDRPPRTSTPAERPPPPSTPAEHPQLSSTPAEPLQSTSTSATELPQPAPRQESQEPTSVSPTTAAQPKVKLSLRDFALRKKKLREEMEATKSSQASPMSVTSALAVEEGEGEVGASPRVGNATSRWIREREMGLVAAAKEEKEKEVVVETERVKEVVEKVREVVEKVKEVLPAVKKVPAAATTMAQTASKEGSATSLKTRPAPPAKESAAMPEEVLTPRPVIDPTKARRNLENLKAFEESVKNSKVNIHELTTANVKALEAMAAAPRPAPAATPVVTSPFVPSAVSPLSTISPPVPKPAERSATNSSPVSRFGAPLNGYHRPPPQISASSTSLISRISPQIPSPSSLASRIAPLPLPPRPTPSMAHTSETREAKKELIDNPISHLSASRPQALKADLPSNPTTYLALPERSMSPISTDPGHSHHSRRPSHEDGEIGEASPPLATQRSFGASFKPRPFAPSFPPPSTSHSPPRGPRALYGPSTSPPATTTAVVNVNSTRPPPSAPSAPRALRQSMMSNRSAGGGSGGGPQQNHAGTSADGHGHNGHGGGSQYIPRGPSAAGRDRDREWGHERHYRGRRGGGGRAR